MPRQHAGSNGWLLLTTLGLVFALVWLTRSRPDEPHLHRANPKAAHRLGALVNQAKGAADTPSAPLAPDVASSNSLRQRIVAVGDIHGDLPAVTSILRRANLIDLKGQWIGGEDILVQTGDIVDRGPDTIALYRFFQTLRAQAAQAGGAVHSLLGNHEMMNELGDWRYVTKEDIASFGGERNRREAFLTGWIGREFRANYSITERVPFLAEASAAARFDPPLQHTAASFVHGGITPEYLSSLDPTRDPIDEMNRIGRDLLFSLLDVPGGVPLSLPRSATPEQRHFWSEEGPMWNREWATSDEDEICDRVQKVCDQLDVRHLVMGHTPQFEGILSRCDGKVLLIDTGISRAYGGAHSSLSITYTLTPASELSLADALALELVSLDDPVPEATLRSDKLRRTWVEVEEVEALYTKGRETDRIGRWERVVERS
ncbi:uncharacterized protein JCM10292_002740 [Rhodotorula paludigena]|uniref:uncharacterized protein n=1 Tax=Rhodotorula paludigena TaxID=86838 RepID=UPI00316E36D0